MGRATVQERPMRPKVRLRAPNDGKNTPEHKTAYLNWILTILCIGVAIWFSYAGYLETRVNTPYDAEKLVSSSSLDRENSYWGSYRSGVYFGMKTRDPHSLVTGMMWYFPEYLRRRGEGLRHWCDQGDRLDRYSWLEHDGKTFGIQEIVDAGAIIKTSFLKKPGGKYGGEWTARIAVTSENKQREGEEISLLYYAATEDKTNGRLRAAIGGQQQLTGIEGDTDGLGFFRININAVKGSVVKHSFLVTVAPGLNSLSDTVLQNLRYANTKSAGKPHIVLAGEQLPLAEDDKKQDPNFVVTQVTAKIPFELEVSFESSSYISRTKKLTGKYFEETLQEHRRLFDEKFEKTFKLAAKGYAENEVNFAKAAFSNMIGSIGYFYGSSQVQSKHTKNPVPYWKAPLFTAVPSRSFFPRGFLWDEGFHGLLISAWDLDTELDIMSHWFDLMNIEGWIPREMILGQEALAKVPEEFVTQVNTNANPPTFFLTLHFILEHNRERLLSKHSQLLNRLYPRLQTWFDWFNTTQLGNIPGTYRWRGRDTETKRELNPKTLTSGLDDYPRSSHPNDDERHVDLRCWITLAAGVLASIADILGKPNQKYVDTYSYLSDNNLLNTLHWSPKTETYSDYGLHTDKVVLKKFESPPGPNTPPPQYIRVTSENPTLQFVDSAFGYVSLFPFMLQIVEPDSPQLEKILQDLRNPDLVWTKYGLRSLAKTSPIYMKKNTEHDPPYWRGAIWMNMNYLTVRALHHYSYLEGPYQSLAKKTYEDLRKNLIRNVLSQYTKSGYIWENYGDTRGEGKGSHPFTGWTSLVVLLMAEIY